MLQLFAQRWWIAALRGALALLFGILAFIFPKAALVAMIFIFGIYALLDGIFAIGPALSLKPVRPVLTLLVIEGVAGILAGIFAFAYPGMTAVALVYLAAAWAVLTGGFQILAAVRIRSHLPGEWLMVVGGIASVVLGILLFAMPQAGLVLGVMLVAAYAVLFGILMIGFGLRLRAIATEPKPMSIPPGIHPV